MDYFPVIMISVGMFIVIHYLVEVHAGSSTSMYDAELGLLAVDTAPPQRSSRGRFLGRMVPLQLAAIGVPLLTSDLRAGTALLVLGLLLHGLCRKRLSVGA